MTEFVSLRPKGYSYLMDDGRNDKKQKERGSVLSNKDLNLMVKKIAY